MLRRPQSHGKRLRASSFPDITLDIHVYSRIPEYIADIIDVSFLQLFCCRGWVVPEDRNVRLNVRAALVRS